MGGSSNNQLFKGQTFSVKKFIPWILISLFPFFLVHFYFFSSPLSISLSHPTSHYTNEWAMHDSCNYSNGRWVHDKTGPLYNGTNCVTIKENQNCMKHGRPDTDYLYWRWSPKDCTLPRFEPKTFLRIFENKHLAFVGDSMARNQLESLLCLLASFSGPELVYSKGKDHEFRRWHFGSHNLTVTIYWSPFLVKGIEKNETYNFNRLFLDSVDEKWAAELEHIDVVVLSVGHWFLHSAVFFYGDSVLGCHFCTGQNYSEIGFYEVFGKAINTTLKTIIERRGGTGRGLDVILTTFSPHHFEGEWNKYGACPKTRPYEEGQKNLEGMDAEMRRVEINEVEQANLNAINLRRLRIRALDVTKLSLLRPDGHPGPYLYPNPFADGIQERVQNDCVHWCLPGPVDTWNEILLDIVRRSA